MPGAGASFRVEQRAHLLQTAFDMLERGGPEALQTRPLAAAVGTSTQAVYTLFGGMPGVFEALVAEGYVRFARHIAAVAETDDPVADHFSKGWAYCEWALEHPQLYRLMFGITGGELLHHAGLEMTVGGTLATFPEGQTALGVLLRSVARMIESGRIRPVDPLIVARQFLSVTHGYVLLEIAGAFGTKGEGLSVIAALAVNLMVGLGDAPEAVQRSLAATLAARRQHPAAW
jgi:AcrR family transcriptional regulator